MQSYSRYTQIGGGRPLGHNFRIRGTHVWMTRLQLSVEFVIRHGITKISKNITIIILD